MTKNKKQRRGFDFLLKREDQNIETNPLSIKRNKPVRF